MADTTAHSTGGSGRVAWGDALFMPRSIAVARAVAARSYFSVRHRSDVAEIDINPIVAGPRGHGATALDALIVPHTAQPEEVMA